MSRFLTIAIASSVALACVGAHGAEGADALLGQWTNIDKESGGVTRLSIKASDQGATLQAWGKCSPEDCDWGVTALHLLGDSVGSRELKYGFASWDHRFKLAHMTLRIEKNVLVAELYDIFTDDSGRANYRSVHKFRRAK